MLIGPAVLRQCSGPYLNRPRGGIDADRKLLRLESGHDVHYDVVSCNTGNWAAAAMFMLHYLGYPDVKLHDESWINWDG